MAVHAPHTRTTRMFKAASSTVLLLGLDDFCSLSVDPADQPARACCRHRQPAQKQRSQSTLQRLQESGAPHHNVFFLHEAQGNVRHVMCPCKSPSMIGILLPCGGQTTCLPECGSSSNAGSCTNMAAVKHYLPPRTTSLPLTRSEVFCSVLIASCLSNVTRQ